MIYNKPITSGIELCRAMAPTALSMDHATEADDMEPTRALQIPRWESCDHIAGMIPRFRNIYPPTVSQNRSRPLLNNSGHCLEKGTGSRSGVEDTTIPDTLVTSISTNAILSTSIHNRTWLISTNSSHCKKIGAFSWLGATSPWPQRSWNLWPNDSQSFSMRTAKPCIVL